MGDTSRSQTISTKLRKIADQAADYPDMRFSTLAHHIDADLLFEAYRLTRKNRAAGVDKVTTGAYEVSLEENLKDLHERLRTGRYQAQPVRRVHIDKEDGKKRPIGIPSLEDKIVQRAVVMLLTPIYEGMFQDFSFGFRPGRSQHQALSIISESCWRLKAGWIVDADVSGFFDNMDHGVLRDFIRRRVNDGGILRLIGKWLNAGVMEEAKYAETKDGVPQGGVVSPLLSNIFLHYVLDEWFVRDVLPRMKGRCFMVRFADDFVIGCEREEDARRIMEVLPKRFNRYGLSVHPEKTKLVDFTRPARNTRKGKGNGTFDFLGFTHYWARSRRGNWVIKRKTVRKRRNRFVKAIWDWCRSNRHLPVPVQHKKLCQKLRGYYQYHGIRFNYETLGLVNFLARRTWRHWLNRRSRKGPMNWATYVKFLAIYPLPKPRIFHSI